MKGIKRFLYIASISCFFLWSYQIVRIPTKTLSLGSNNVCIYESLGTQAYLSLQPNVCQHRSPKYIGPGQLYIISIIKSQHIVFWTQCVDGYKDGYNTMMTQFNYTHWSYNICWHEIASHLMPFNNIYHKWWSNQSWCKLTYFKNSKTMNLSWHTCMK